MMKNITWGALLTGVLSILFGFLTGIGAEWPIITSGVFALVAMGLIGIWLVMGSFRADKAQNSETPWRSIVGLLSAILLVLGVVFDMLADMGIAGGIMTIIGLVGLFGTMWIIGAAGEANLWLALSIVAALTFGIFTFVDQTWAEYVKISGMAGFFAFNFFFMFKSAGTIDDKTA